MGLVELGDGDRDRIVTALRGHGALQAYALGDVDPFFWPYTRWLGWEEEGALTEVALLYAEPDPPVLHALTPGDVVGLRQLLDEAASLLPDRVYAHLSDGLVDPPPAGYALEHAPVPHTKMALVHGGALARHATGAFELLGPANRGELEQLYAAAYPQTWFQPRMLETGRYVGRREHGRLVAVAGVHLYSRAYRVAALGNVATHPDVRGRGVATALCAQLCLLLAGDGVETIALNVAADNDAALAVYTRLGFEEVGRFDEVGLVRPPGPARAS